MPETNGYIQTAPDSTGKQIDNSEVTVDAATRYRQRIRVAGVDPTELQDVLNASPSKSKYGAVVRPILPESSSGSTATVSVGTSATLIKAANSNRFGIVFTHDTLGAVLYWGFTSGVTTSNGLPLEAHQYIEPTVLANYVGDLYGIVVSGTCSVRVAEFT